MTLTKAALVEFIRRHRHGVEASLAANGAPEAALVSLLVNEDLELFFDSFDSTRKVANLRRDPRIALVIGGCTPGDERTVQYEGVVDLPTGAELEHFKRDYFAVHPDGQRRSGLAGITYFRVRPAWIRYNNLNVAPPEIVVFKRGAGLPHEDGSKKYYTDMPYTQTREPWQPKVEHEALFNPFVKTRDEEL
jgi:hypothetical protein